MQNIIYSLMLIALVACTPSTSQESKVKIPQNFNDYWYAGEAEITSYELEQARYGEIHKGNAVLVFVTEPFSKSKQVKLDDWKEREDNVSVLKLNMTKNFLTGIYPYSMMMSTFTPVSYDQYPNPFKVTTTSQEWCGHTFMQLNRENNGYQLRGFSYFESEGDVDQRVPDVILEDELWTRIRLNPTNLPIGEINFLPATFYLRLRHKELTPVKAKTKLMTLPTSDYASQSHSLYEIEYSDRSLRIYFDQGFPYTIFGWEETHLSGFGDPVTLTTKAKRIQTIKSAYWGKNSNADRIIRKELGLGID